MAQTKTQNGRKYQKIGARWVDITGLSREQIQQVVDGAKNGGSVNSRKIADGFRKGNGTTSGGGGSKKDKGSNTSEGLGRNNKDIDTNLNNPDDVLDDAGERNRQAAADSNESKNPGSVTSANGDTWTSKVDKDGRAIIETKYGPLTQAFVDRIDETTGDALSRQDATLGDPLFNMGNFEDSRGRMEDSYANRFKRLYGDQFSQAQQDLKTSLIQQGFAPGTAQYQKAIDQLDARQRETQNDWLDRSIQQGAQESQRYQDVSNKGRDQSIKEQLALQQQKANLDPKNMPTWQGTDVKPADTEGVYGSYTDAKSSKYAQDKAAENAERNRQAELERRVAEEEGKNQGGPTAGDIGGGLGKIPGSTSNMNAAQVSLPGSVLNQNTQAATTPTSPTTTTFNMNALPTTSTFKINSQPLASQQMGQMAAQDNQMGAQPRASTQQPLVQQSAQSTQIGAQPKANIQQPLIKPKVKIQTQPLVKSTKMKTVKFNPFANKTGFLKA